MKEHSVVRLRRSKETGDRSVAFVHQDFDNAGFKPGLSVVWHLASNTAVNMNMVNTADADGV